MLNTALNESARSRAIVEGHRALLCSGAGQHFYSTLDRSRGMLFKFGNGINLGGMLKMNDNEVPEPVGQTLLRSLTFLVASLQAGEADLAEGSC